MVSTDTAVRVGRPTAPTGPGKDKRCSSLVLVFAPVRTRPSQKGSEKWRQPRPRKTRRVTGQEALVGPPRAIGGRDKR